MPLHGSDHGVTWGITQRLAHLCLIRHPIDWPFQWTLIDSHHPTWWGLKITYVLDGLTHAMFWKLCWAFVLNTPHAEYCDQGHSQLRSAWLTALWGPPSAEWNGGTCHQYDLPSLWQRPPSPHPGFRATPGSLTGEGATHWLHLVLSLSVSCPQMQGPHADSASGEVHPCWLYTLGPRRGLDMEFVFTGRCDGAGFPPVSELIHDRLGKSRVFLLLQRTVIPVSGHKPVW